MDQPAPAVSDGLFDNPLGTDGFEFVEFTAPEPERLRNPQSAAIKQRHVIQKRAIAIGSRAQLLEKIPILLHVVNVDPR